MAGSHLVMVSAFIEAEDAAKAISDPVKRQQMLDGLAKAWEFAKENPGAAGLEGTWAVIKGTVEDAWNVTSHTVESIAQNALGEDPLDAGLASSAALVAAIAFINPIRKGTKAAKALLKRAKEARRVKLSKADFPEIKSTVSRQKQNRHIADTDEYRGGGVFSSQADAQKVLDAYNSGKATVIGKNKQGNPIVRFSEVTGINNNVGANITNQPTNVFKIKGTKSPSVVPIDPTWKP